MKEALHVTTFKLQTLIGLQLHGLVTTIKNLGKCTNHVRGSFAFNRLGPAPSAKHVNHSQNVFESIIVTGIRLHVHEISLPLVVDTTRGIVTRQIALPRWLVER